MRLDPHQPRPAQSDVPARRSVAHERPLPRPSQIVERFKDGIEKVPHAAARAGLLGETQKRIEVWTRRLEQDFSRGDAFKDASADEKKDKALLLALVQQFPGVMRHADPSVTGDRDFVLALVDRNGCALDACPEFHDDKEVLLRAMASNPYAARCIGPQLCEDPEVAEAVVACGQGLAHLSDRWRDDEAFVRRAIEQNAWQLGGASDRLRDDPRMVVLAASKGCLTGVSERWKNDREMARVVVEVFPDGLSQLSEPFRDDPELVREAIKGSPNAIFQASERLQQSFEMLALQLECHGNVYLGGLSRDAQERFLLGPARADTRAVSLADPSVSFNPRTMAELCRKNPLLLESEAAWKILESLPGTEFQLPSHELEEMKALRQESRARCGKIGIDFPARFSSIRTIEEVEHNRAEAASGGRTRLDGTPDDRPLAIVVFPKTDHNKAFEFNDLDRLARGYRLVYFEAHSDKAVAEAIRSASRDGGDRAQLLIVGAHGEKKAMHFDERGLGLIAPLTVDAGDGRHFEGLDRWLAEGAHIVLDSCSTGKGGAGARNVANMFGSAAPNCSLWAPQKPTSSTMVLDRVGRLVRPHYFGAECYHLPPGVHELFKSG